jgi:hypothetical protein
MKLHLTLLIHIFSISKPALCRTADRRLLGGRSQAAASRLSIRPRQYTSQVALLPLHPAAPSSVTSVIMTGSVADSLPPLVHEDGDDDVLAGYSSTISSLFRSGHHKWGFIVYRTTYDDEEAWKRFMDVLTRGADLLLRKSNKQRLQPYLFWTTMEDRNAFDGASKDAIRDHFRDWVSMRTVERDGPGADSADIARTSPRYRVCLYVDKAAVDAASLDEVPNPYGIEYYRIKDRVVLIDGQFSQHPGGALELDEYELQEIADGEYTLEDVEDNDDTYDPIEGRTSYDVGWMYIQLQFVSSSYERLAESAHEWTEMYKRPPGAYP